MPEPLQPALARVRAALLDPDGLVRAVAAGRRKGERPAWRRAELRWVDLREGRLLQVVTHDETQSFTRNVAADEVAPAVDALLAEPFGNWHVDTTTESLQLRVTKRGEAQVHRRAQEGPAAPDRAHDRTKPRLLDPADPVLRALGISDAAGRVKPSRRDKYRQVEEFLRAMDPVLDRAREAAGGGPLRVVDLGCGNAYLTLAAYRRLTDGIGLDVELVGVDVKAQARERNSALASELGWADRVRFVEGTIDGAVLDPPPHLVLALHACDTATDDALARAVRWAAPVVLAAPCCHHDVQAQLAGGSVPAPYGLVARHGILRERMADVLTDALRAALLRLLGYRVDVVEFVESAHTPRNVLLRAVRTGAAVTDEQRDDYAALTRLWSLTPALQRRLPAEVAAAMS
ncbi:MAG TPA: SAM-dependent methyltransferase [Jiangellales bacterium]|nr:SAM-dependent methyltransferase [Jiangellales bacterium]